MTVTNGYVTAADLITYLGSNFSSSNTNATMIDQAVDAASRAIDNDTRRVFYPHIETNRYDAPEGRELDLADDLLELLEVTNGDATTIPTTEFSLLPYNVYPKNELLINAASVYGFVTSTTTAQEGAVSVQAIYGYAQRYTQSWAAGSTLNGAITTTSATSITATSGTPFANGNIIRIDNELLRVTNVSTNTLTVERGWNGSTAATHLTLANMRIWKPDAIIVQCTKIQAARLYRRFETIYGTTGGGEMGVQAVVIPGLDPDVKQMLSGLFGSIL
jgi:hypothetical protein